MKTIPEKLQKYRDKIEALHDKIKVLREGCDHMGVHIHYGANTGNWCPQDNTYWIDWRCPTCDHTWTTDQSRSAYLEQQRLKAVKI